jgi:hypothetical protein
LATPFRNRPVSPETLKSSRRHSDSVARLLSAIDVSESTRSKCRSLCDLHAQNFLECVRTRQTPAAAMKLAFQAALEVQMANLSLKHGRRMCWTGDKAV